MKPVNLSYEEFPEDLTTRENIKELAYQRYDKIRLKEVIYDAKHNLKLLLINQNQKLPFILYVQGSAWRKQNLTDNLFELYEFAKRGFQIGIVQYRDTSIAPFPAQVIDSKKALKYAFEHAEELNIDSNNVFLWGDSSGGHTVLMMWATYNKQYQDFKLPPINGVIDFYGPTNITTMSDYPSTYDHVAANSPEGMLLGGLNVLEHPQLAKITAIKSYLDQNSKLVPLIIFHGTKDRLVPFHQSIELFDYLNECQLDCTFYKLNQGDHGGETFWHLQTLDQVYQFINQNLKR